MGRGVGDGDGWWDERGLRGTTVGCDGVEGELSRGPRRGAVDEKVRGRGEGGRVGEVVNDGSEVWAKGGNSDQR